MSFEWLSRFNHGLKKNQNYAEKTLAAYAFGMRAKGSITGIRIETGPDCCDAARLLGAGKVYLPKDAPSLPLPDCPRGSSCGCVYRPVMKYQRRD